MKDLQPLPSSAIEFRAQAREASPFGLLIEAQMSGDPKLQAEVLGAVGLSPDTPNCWEEARARIREAMSELAGRLL